jgi:hypothetical protein
MSLTATKSVPRNHTIDPRNESPILIFMPSFFIADSRKKILYSVFVSSGTRAKCNRIPYSILTYSLDRTLFGIEGILARMHNILTKERYIYIYIYKISNSRVTLSCVYDKRDTAKL